MLGLTKKTGYGLIALAHLAELDDGQVASAAKIAELFQVPKALLMNVMKELAAAGFIESVRGAAGGYRLAKTPEAICLADLVAAVERPVLLADCRTRRAEGRPCTADVMACCPVADPVHRFHRRLDDFLKAMTLADILSPRAVAKAQAGREGAADGRASGPAAPEPAPAAVGSDEESP